MNRMRIAFANLLPVALSLARFGSGQTPAPVELIDHLVANATRYNSTLPSITADEAIDSEGSSFLKHSHVKANGIIRVLRDPASGEISEVRQIAEVDGKWNHSLGDYQGFGRADLLGTDLRGIEFTFECGQPFMANSQHGEFYQARWKKQDKELELFVQRVGSDHTSKCTLKTSMKPAAFSNMSAGWLKPLPARAPAATPTPATTPPPPR